MKLVGKNGLEREPHANRGYNYNILDDDRHIWSADGIDGRCWVQDKVGVCCVDSLPFLTQYEI